MVDDVLAGYPRRGADEAVDTDGRLRGPYAVLGPVLDRLGLPGLRTTAAALAAEREHAGVVVGSWTDGAQQIRPLPLDPVPRVLSAQDWTALAAGVEQRHRALNAFLADAYRAAGRRRSDPDRDPAIVRAGVLPAWAIAHHPSRNSDAVGMAWPEQPRAALAATDVVRGPGGQWLATADHLRAPAGLGYALANRHSVERTAPELPRAAAPGLTDPGRNALLPLRRGLLDAAPPLADGPPRLAVLTAGSGDPTWFEHRLLAESLDAPVVLPRDLWPRMDGGVAMRDSGRRVPVDVLHLRLDDAELGAHRSGSGQPLSGLLADAVRAGRLGLVNVPGNGLADDAATFPLVPAMIRFYLGEEPLLGSVPTWVLADAEQWAQVQDRLHELVLTPVIGYGGTVVGRDCSAAELAVLQAEISVAPHRFVAREPVECSTVPTLVDGELVPRPVCTRVFSVTGETTRALAAPLTGTWSVDDLLTAGPTRDTWLVT